jgi:hypothetical protein
LGQYRTNFQVLFRRNSLFIGPTSMQTPMECQPRVLPFLRSRSRWFSEEAMDLRHSTVTKNGKTHTYWRLVRSVRVGRKVRQETIAQLGELDAKGRIAARHLADSLVGVERPSGLFDEELPTAPVTVVPSRLRLERGRRFGDVWLAWKLWQVLRLDTWLENRLPRGREDVPWSPMAAVLVIARLFGAGVEPTAVDGHVRQPGTTGVSGVARWFRNSSTRRSRSCRSGAPTSWAIRPACRQLTSTSASSASDPAAAAKEVLRAAARMIFPRIAGEKL